MLGFGSAVKWSAIFFLPVFLLLLFFWGVGLRRTVGAAAPVAGHAAGRGWAGCSAVGVCVLAAYLASWTGWFVTDTGWKRHYLAVERLEPELPVIGALRNLWYYHVDVLNFHETTELARTRTSPGRGSGCSWPGRSPSTGSVTSRAAPPSATPRSRCSARPCCGGPSCPRWSGWPGSASAAATGGRWRSGPGSSPGSRRGSTTRSSTAPCSSSTPRRLQPFLVLAVVYCLGALINGPGVGRLGRQRGPLGLRPAGRGPAALRHRLRRRVHHPRRDLLLVVLPALRRRVDPDHRVDATHAARQPLDLTMSWTTTTDLVAFLAATGEQLRARPAENTILLTIGGDAAVRRRAAVREWRALVRVVDRSGRPGAGRVPADPAVPVGPGGRARGGAGVSCGRCR